MILLNADTADVAFGLVESKGGNASWNASLLRPRIREIMTQSLRMLCPAAYRSRLHLTMLSRGCESVPSETADRWPLREW
jgi:hypothetical protein